ncbi:TonB-dependent receptor [Pedobacter cryoconitis]|uniref:TonB-linked SusC/RagA family outer membrane protein n=1 Tax=Pedobacter cryoconitis TaxID=188932 RepID=A0A327SS53_9SPHI|nr:TonB-dependent receptor [Pedobacter cryoconitis]RAJ28547.1 TonB-linked SusC/RagA family outer membrane protein [Pedobacter cryoconitis]
MKKKRFVALIKTAMRISMTQIFLGILFTCTSFAKNVTGQEILNKEISININQGQIKQILTEIQLLTKVNFVYSSTVIKAQRKVTVSAVNKVLGQLLDETLNPLNIYYKVEDNQILLYEKDLSGLTIGLPGNQNQLTVKGKVTSDKGEPLPGVSVNVKGTKIGTTTDVNGSYAIVATGPDVVLVFSYIGFTAKEMPVNGRTTLNVQLVEELTSLGEVVVVGYGTQRKKDLTSAVSVVNVGSMIKQPTASVNNLLQGQASGVTVLGSGQPGEEPQVRIRGVNTFGNNNPLYVVDGVPTQSIADLNPNDIETMQVLKDAGSASIYGSRAANGVIVITTKKGKGKVTVTYDAYYGTQRPKGGNVWNMLNPQEMADLKHMAMTNSGATDFVDSLYGSGPTYVLPDYILPAGAKEGDPRANPSLYKLKPFYTSANEFNSFYRISKANKEGTDWYHEIFKPASITSQNVAITGGSDQGSYLFSANYFNQQGTLLNTYLKRYTIRSNSQYNVSKHVRVGENLAYSITNNPQIAGLSGDNAIGHAFREQPIIPVRDIMGNFAGSYGGNLGDAYNPVAMQERTKDNKSQQNRLFGNIFAEADLTDFLTIRSQFGGENYSGATRAFVYPQYENSENSTTNSYSESALDGYNYSWTNTLSFNKTFNKHRIKAVAGTEFFRENTHVSTGSNQGYFSFDPDYTNLSTGGGPMKTTSERTANTLFSLIGRVDYSYNDKYLIGATIRRDGSSKFLQHVYGWFPAVSAGWRISQEGFLKNVKWITDLKIRGGYGIMGNQLNVSGGNSFTTFGSKVGTSYYAIGGGNNIVSGFYQNQTGNPGAKWEKNINSNFGFDATLFGGHIDISADYYRKNIKDLLYNPEMIGTSGAAKVPFVNIAQMKNNGFDISVSGNTQVSSSVKLNATATITTYHNEIQKISGGSDYYDVDARRFDGSNIIRNAVGHPISQFFGYKTDGFWNSQQEVDEANKKAQAASGNPNDVYQTDIGVGRFKYADVNGDGRITADDRTFLGNANPSYSYGLNLGVTYKNWDFSAFFYGVQGNSIWNQVKWWTDFNPSFGGAKSKTALYDSWTPQNHNASAPIQETSNSFSTNAVPNSYFVENGSYLRLKNAQIGYSFNSARLQKIGVNKLRVYLSGANLFTITKYSGVDPEIGTSSETGQQTAYGVDDGSYPSQRTFLVGLNLSF